MIFSLAINAEGESVSSGARWAGLSNAAVISTDVFTVFANQAGLAKIKNITAGAFSEKPYFLKSIGRYGLSICVPTRTGVFGIGISYYGFKWYNEKIIGLGFGKKLAPNLAFGIKLDYLSYTISEYGYKNVVSYEIGLLTKINPEVRVGAHVQNPLKVLSGTFQQELLPTDMTLGFSYLPGKKVMIAVEIEKDIDFDASLKTGIEYKITRELMLRGGFRINPAGLSFGIGYRLQMCIIDSAFTYHPVLGFTPHISITSRLRKQNDKK